MAATRQKVGDGISRTSAISRAPDTENRAFRHYGTSDERTTALRHELPLANVAFLARMRRMARFEGVCMGKTGSGKLHDQPVPLTPRQILTCSAKINSADCLRGLAKPGVAKDA
jgi:hypothetical protein